MVQKYESPVRVYKYPFELVMAAYERRFPTCPMIPIFVGSETVSEETSEDGASHVIERRCRLAIDAPYLLKKIIGVEHVLFIQKNSKDFRTRALKIEAHNESFASRILISETCNYFVHPQNPNWTCFDQSASLEVKSFFGFENAVEKIAVKHYSANIAKGKEIIEFFIDELKSEGITTIPPWMHPGGNNNQKLQLGQGDSTSHQESSDGEKSAVDEEEEGGGEEESLEFVAVGPTVKVSHPPLSRARSGSASATKETLRRCDSFGEGDEKYRLDGEYIQRYLGELSLLQESQLIQLRTCLAHLQKAHMPSDRMLLRFLRAADFNIEKARESLSASLTWRKKHQVDKLLSEYQVPEVVETYFPGGWHHSDKDGRPVFVLRLGMMDVKGLLKSVGEEGLLQLTLHVCEEGLRLTEEATLLSGHPITTWTLLLDLEGLNMRHLWRPGIRALLRIIEIVEANYPETMGLVLIIRAPRVFPLLWTLVRTFIDERTCSKFFFYSGNDYQGTGGLPDYIPPNFLPQFLGGTSQTSIPEGSLIPKSYYMGDEVLESLTLSETSIYTSISLGKGQVHELVVLNEDSGSVLTWDFDILRHEVIFSIFTTKTPIPFPSTPPPVPPSSSLRETERGGCAQYPHNHHPSSSSDGIQTHQTSANPNEHKSVIEKSWKEGVEYRKLEPPLICHDGESIQGSHILATTGYYILQWKFGEGNPTTCSSSSHHLMDSITPSKAKVMYHYEILKSTDYGGSMSSLQSHTSGFSSLGSKTNLSGKS